MIKRKILAAFAVFLSLFALNVHANQSQYTTEKQIELRVFFDENSAVIKPQYQAEINKVADAIYQTSLDFVSYKKLNPNTPNINFLHSFKLEGHTDGIEARKKSNKQLSQKRAIAVRNAIVSNLNKRFKSKVFETKDFRVEGNQDSKPIDTNETKNGRAMNRRVYGGFRVVY